MKLIIYTKLTDKLKKIIFNLREKISGQNHIFYINGSETLPPPLSRDEENEIMQKILPRIQGSSRAIKDVLSELFVKCAGDYTGLAGAADFEQMLAYTDSDKNCKYPNSAKKIAFMMRRYEEDGFTSYWL